MEFTAELIASFIGGEVVGDKNAKVTTFAKIEEGHAGALSFLSNPKYEPYVYDTDSSVVIVNKSFEPKETIKATLVKVEDSYAAFAKLLELYAANKPAKKGISDKSEIAASAHIGDNAYVGAFAVIDEGAKIGNNVKIFPHVYVGDGVIIGDNVTLNSGVKIYEGCVLGSNIIIHSGAIIGADGFGFAPNPDGSYSKIPQIGNVIIEDNVEIGANTCIDRSTMGSTIISKGVKMDNLIQIAHNVTIGTNTAIAAQCGIAGSSKVGSNCILAGQAGVVGHINIGNNVTVASQTGMTNSVPDGGTYIGFPAMQSSQYRRTNAVYRNLIELDKTVHRLDKTVKKLTEEKGE